MAIGHNSTQKAITSVANAIKYPDKFWEWIKSEPAYAANKDRVHAAEEAVKRAGFDWDKAMMYAAAYLTVKEPVPVVQVAQPINSPDFPYWVAFDKHTILENAAYHLGMPTDRVKSLTFYKAGAVCNQISDSPYWDMVFNTAEAENDWNKIMPIIINQTKQDVDKLKARLSGTEGNQLTLF